MNHNETIVDNSPHRVFVSVVSHGHENHIINTLEPHRWLTEARGIIPAILSNLPSPELRKYCENYGITYIENSQPLGFGANNNKVFQTLKPSYGVSDSDFFFVINPDIQTSGRDIETIADQMHKEQLPIAAPNLVSSNGVPEDNIRTFPTLLDCVLRFTLKSKRSCIEKTDTTKTQKVDWAAGAFMAFRASSYMAVNGFNEKYFMYYEDADICRRALKNGLGTYYLPTISAKHLAARNSRKIFSRHLIWHVESAVRFTLAR